MTVKFLAGYNSENKIIFSQRLTSKLAEVYENAVTVRKIEEIVAMAIWVLLDLDLDDFPGGSQNTYYIEVADTFLKEEI